MNAKTVGILGISVFSTAALAGCVAGGIGEGSNDEQVGLATLDLTGAPVDARCAVVTTTPATGAAQSKQFPLSPGQTAVFNLSGLPTGNVTMTEQVYTVACSAVTATTPAAWSADPVSVTLVQGVTSNVTFNLHAGSGGQVSARNNFPSAGSNPITEYLATGNGGSSYNSITTGSDDNLWLAESAGNAISRITPAGVVTRFTNFSGDRGLNGIVAGSDGALWFTEGGTNQIGRITTAGVVTAEYNIPTANAYPSRIVLGRDGALWFTENRSNKIGRITVNGSISEFAIPTARSAPLGITVGSDNNIWFTEQDGNRIARMTPSGVVTEFPLPTAGSAPSGITAGPDGNLWFTEYSATNRIGRITPTGTITEFTIPTAGVYPSGISTGPDGNLWFGEWFGFAVGRITPTGVISEFPLPQATFPGGLTTGPDGGVWFGEGYGKAARIQP
ncbi:MAG: hypothetical protein WDO74_12225 [Pseudomonadota bacterium]